MREEGKKERVRGKITAKAKHRMSFICIMNHIISGEKILLCMELPTKITMNYTCMERVLVKKARNTA